MTPNHIECRCGHQAPDVDALLAHCLEAHGQRPRAVVVPTEQPLWAYPWPKAKEQV